jgi:hypothetical protein
MVYQKILCNFCVQENSDRIYRKFLKMLNENPLSSLRIFLYTKITKDFVINYWSYSLKKKVLSLCVISKKENHQLVWKCSNLES